MNHVTTQGFDEVIRALKELPKALDLDRDRLGTDLLDIVSDGIEFRAANQSGPGNVPWKANDPHYAASKGYRPVGVNTGLMLNHHEVQGERRIMPDRAIMTYGVDQDAREHAAGFTGGGRPFYEIDDSDEALIVAACERKIENAIKAI